VPNEDESISKSFERAFRKRGIDFKLGVRFSRPSTQNDQGVRFAVRSRRLVTGSPLLERYAERPGRSCVTAEKAHAELEVDAALAECPARKMLMECLVRTRWATLR